MNNTTLCMAQVANHNHHHHHHGYGNETKTCCQHRPERNKSPASEIQPHQIRSAIKNNKNHTCGRSRCHTTTKPKQTLYIYIYIHTHGYRYSSITTYAITARHETETELLNVDDIGITSVDMAFENPDLPFTREAKSKALLLQLVLLLWLLAADQPFGPIRQGPWTSGRVGAPSCYFVWVI